MKKRILTAAFLTIALLLSTFVVYAFDEINEPEYYTFEDGVGKNEIPYGEDDRIGTIYGYSSFKMMNEAQAAAAGVPEGYSGWVLALGANNSGASIGLDLTDIKVSEIEKITFRVWCPTGTKNDGVRITNDSKTSWIMLANPGTTGKWIDVVLDETSNFNTAIKNFSVFDDGNGYCKTVNFCFRGSNLGIAYIDSITVEIKAPDIAPPVIEYSGETEITTTAGQPFSVKAEAVDEYNNEKISPEYIFSDGAVDENGLLLEGEHSCTLRFTDDAGNFSELKFSIKVEPKDTVAPTFSWAPDKIYANAGMRPVLSIAVDDNRDNEIEPVLVWSKGTFDNKGRFIVGEHTLTISAVDDTGNKIEKIIPVSVAAGLPKIIQS